MVTIRIAYIPGSGALFQTISSAIESNESVILPVELPGNATAIHVHVRIAPVRGGKRDQPMCLGGVVFQAANEAILLTELTQAVHLEAARYQRLTSAKTRQASIENYLTQHRWIRFNPDKKHSTWETASYLFMPDGTFERLNKPTRLNPRIREGNWKVKESGLVVLAGDDIGRFRLIPCRNHRGYLCVNKVAMRPRQAF